MKNNVYWSSNLIHSFFSILPWGLWAIFLINDDSNLIQDIYFLQLAVLSCVLLSSIGLVCASTARLVVCDACIEIRILFFLMKRIRYKDLVTITLVTPLNKTLETRSIHSIVYGKNLKIRLASYSIDVPTAFMDEMIGKNQRLHIVEQESKVVNISRVMLKKINIWFMRFLKMVS